MLQALKKQIKISNSLNTYSLRSASVNATKLRLNKKFNQNNQRVPELFKNSTSDDYVSWNSRFLMVDVDPQTHR